MDKIQKELNQVLKETPVEMIENKLDEYEDYLDSLSMMQCVSDLQKEKKKIVYNYVIKNGSFRAGYISSRLNSDEDRKILINILKDKKTLSFDVMKFMNNPKILDKEIIISILSCKNSLAIYEYFGELFMDVILERDVIDQYDAYKLLEKKDILSEEAITKIYEKSFNNISDYLVVLKYLDNDEKKVLTRIFINKKHDNVDIIKRILKDKNYYKEDYDKLILLVGMFGSASIIYDTLMEEKNLNASQVKMLEKSLLETHDIEYITYYYFFKNKEKFIALFGSALLFLSYVEMNKTHFKNTNILELVISKIKEEEINFVEDVNDKINISYHKERK